MEIDTFYNSLLDDLASGSLEKMVSSAATFLHQHVVVLDNSYNVLASYPREQIGDMYWDAQQQYGFVPEENLNRIFENKYPDATFRGVKYLDWGDILFPRAVSTVQHKNRSLGHVSIYHTDGLLSKEDLMKACECLERVLKIYFLNSEGVYASSNAVTSALVSKVFLGQQVTPTLLSQWEKAVGYSLTGDFFLVAFRSEDLQFGKSEVIYGRMNSIHRYVAAAEINKYNYLLFYNIRSKRYAEAICERLLNFLRSYNLYAGVSELFKGLGGIQAYMFQSRRALDIAQETGTGQYMNFYENVFAEVMMSFITNNMDAVNYVHPLLKKLKGDDALNDTQYYETLITYLNCMCDSAVSAKQLNIHRNTLLYRVNHIQENYQCSFRDERLMKALCLSAFVCEYKQALNSCEKVQTENQAF